MVASFALVACFVGGLQIVAIGAAAVLYRDDVIHREVFDQ
jgi:hypothetical protein